MGAEVSVEAMVDPPHASLQEEVAYVIQVRVSGERPEVKRPKLPQDLPFRVEELPISTQVSSSIQIINGKMQRDDRQILSLAYRLVPRKTGRIQIPSLPVVVDGREYRTKAVFVTVEDKPAAGGGGFQALQELSAAQILPGQTVTLTYRFLLPEGQVVDFRPDIPLQELTEDFQLPDNLPRQLSRRRRIVNGVAVIEAWYAVELRPKRAGKFTLPRPSMQVIVVERGGRRRRVDPFMDPFEMMEDMMGARKRLTFEGEEITLTVAEPPQEGRPAEYAGLVGAVEVDASVAPSECAVGEPVILTVRLKGAAAPAEARLPEFAKSAAWAKDFRVSGDAPPQVEEGVAVFKRTLRAVRAGMLQVPPVRVPFYNPEKKAYGWAESRPLELKVSAGRQVRYAPAQESASEAEAAPQAVQDGLEPNREALEVTPRWFAPGGRWWRNRPFWIVLGVPPVFVILALLWRRLRRGGGASAAARAKRQAKGRCLAALQKMEEGAPETADALYAAMQRFFQERLQLPPGSASFAEIAAAAEREGIPAERVAPFRELLAECEGAKYAGGSAAAQGLRERLMEAVRQL